jgi:hypothetical protein
MLRRAFRRFEGKKNNNKNSIWENVLVYAVPFPNILDAPLEVREMTLHTYIMSCSVTLLNNLAECCLRPDIGNTKQFFLKKKKTYCLT